MPGISGGAAQWIKTPTLLAERETSQVSEAERLHPPSLFKLWRDKQATVGERLNQQG